MHLRGAAERQGASAEMKMSRYVAVVLLACAPPTVASAAAPVSAAETAYRINPGDQLDIYVWGDERLQRTMTVLPDGSFAFPLAGTVHAAGKTPAAIEGELSKLLAGQYKGVPPQVTVSVKAASGLQISVVGKVKTPGAFSPTHYVSALDALALAGGPTEFADVNNIIILRHEGDHTVVVRTRLGNILKGRPSGADLSGEGVPELKAGDTLVVP